MPENDASGWVLTGRNHVGALLSSIYGRFLLVGLLNTAFGYGLFLLMIQTPLPLFWACLFSNIGAILFNFRTLGRLVFRKNDRHLVFRFVAGYGLHFLVGYAVLRGVMSLGVPVVTASAALLAPMAVVSFAINRLFVFRASSANSVEASMS